MLKEKIANESDYYSNEFGSNDKNIKKIEETKSLLNDEISEIFILKNSNVNTFKKK